jgi:protein TonB
MFDKLVESTNQKPQGRRKFYLVTSLIYGTALSVLAVFTILWFNPAMAEANSIEVKLTPLPLLDPVPLPDPIVERPTPEVSFAAPVKIPEKIADPAKVPPKTLDVTTRTRVPGVPPIGGPGGGAGWNPTGSGNEPRELEPPPPPPTPKATPPPEPAPKTPDIVPMTSTMITGKAIRKVQPPYPQIAKQVRAQGTVPVQITISEDGRVLSATVVSGHPTLHDAAKQAAMQWVFSPTVLNGKAVKVSGVISFNFILN